MASFRGEPCPSVSALPGEASGFLLLLLCLSCHASVAHLQCRGPSCPSWQGLMGVFCQIQTHPNLPVPGAQPLSLDDACSIIASNPQQERAQACYLYLFEVLSTRDHHGSPALMKQWCGQQDLPQAPSLCAVETKAPGDHGAPLHSGASPVAAPWHDSSVTPGHLPGGLGDAEMKLV